MKAIKIIVSGRVQGVSFRRFIQLNANRLGLKGYVKNIPSEKVEIVAEGEKDKIKELIDITRKGSPWSYVEDLETKEIEPFHYSDFEIKY